MDAHSKRAEQDEQIPMTVTVQDWEGPQTIDEARCFDQGYKSGVTTYAREKGDSTLKSENELLRRLIDEQGWMTIETFERIQADDAARCRVVGEQDIYSVHAGASDRQQ